MGAEDWYNLGGVMRMDKELLEAIREELSPIKQDVAQIHQDISRMDQKMTRMDQDISRIDQNMAQMDQDISRIDQNMARMDQDISRMDQDITRIKIILEHDIPKQLSLLAEGQSIILERLPKPGKAEEIEDRVDVLETVVTMHSADIADLKKAL